MTEPTEVVTIPMTEAHARVAGIAPDGRIALQIDFADAEGNRTVVFTIHPKTAFKLSDDLWRKAFQAALVEAREWAGSEVERIDFANSEPMGSA